MFNYIHFDILRQLRGRHHVHNKPKLNVSFFFRLTLLLSCAMHFENYPHDEQNCKLSMESRK